MSETITPVAEGTNPASAVEELARELGVRKITVLTEEILRDGSGALATSVTRAAAAAVIRNPWIGSAVSTDLAPETERIAPVLAKILTDRLTAALGGAGEIEAFGKSAVVGLKGEVEHAAALIHTPFFGNLVHRRADVAQGSRFHAQPLPDSDAEPERCAPPQRDSRGRRRLNRFASASPHR